MKRITLLSALFLWLVGGYAQIDQYVIGSLGGEIGKNTNSTYRLTHSIGDVAGTSIGEASTPLLVQGFPQCFACDDCLPLDLEDLFSNPLINVFPNPTSGLLQLEGETRLIYRYELYSPNGQQVQAAQLGMPQLDLSALSTGIYLLRVYGHDQQLTFLGKIVKN
jgi:hypothetical protein